MKYLFSTTYHPKGMDLALLLLRVSFGIFLAVHGYPKLQTLLGGGPGDFPDPLGIGPKASLFFTVFAEFFCSLLLILGLATRLILVPLIFTMLVIVFAIHGSDGFGKQEAGLHYLVVYLTLLLTGAGRYSLDGLISRSRS